MPCFALLQGPVRHSIHPTEAGWGSTMWESREMQRVCCAWQGVLWRRDMELHTAWFHETPYMLGLIMLGVFYFLFVCWASQWYGKTYNKPAVQAPEEMKHRVYAAGILGAVELCQRGCQNRRDYVWQYFCIHLLVCPAPNCLIGSDWGMYSFCNNR